MITTIIKNDQLYLNMFEVNFQDPHIKGSSGMELRPSYPESWSIQICSARFTLILSQQKRTQRVILIIGIFKITLVKKNTLLENQLIQDHKKQKVFHNIVQALCRHHYILCSISNHEEKCSNPSGGESLEKRPHASADIIFCYLPNHSGQDMYSNIHSHSATSSCRFLTQDHRSASSLLAVSVSMKSLAFG